MKNLLTIYLLLAFSNMPVRAQSNWSREQCFTTLNYIVSQSVGEKFIGGLFLNRNLVVITQKFSETNITSTIKDQDVSYVNRYSSMSWKDLLGCVIDNEQSRISKEGRNIKLHELHLFFKTNVKCERIYNDENVDETPHFLKSIDDIHILEQYIDEFQKIVNRLVELKNS